MTSETQREEYELPVFEGLDDGSEVGETVTVRATEKKSDLRAIHQHEGGTDKYRFRITDDEIPTCSFISSYSDSPETPPSRVLQAIEYFGYRVRGKSDLDRGYDKAAAETAEMYADEIRNIFNADGDVGGIDREGAVARSAAFPRSSATSLVNLLELRQRLTPQQFEAVHDAVMGNVEFPNVSQDVHERLAKLTSLLADTAIDTGYTDEFELAEN